LGPCAGTPHPCRPSPEAAAGQKRAADDDVVAGPVVKRVCLPTEAPRKITIINANSVKEVDAHRDEVPHMNTAEAREV